MPALAESTASERPPVDDGALVAPDATDTISLPNSRTVSFQSPPSGGSHITSRLGYTNNTGTCAIMDIIGASHSLGDPHVKPMNDIASAYNALIRQLPPKNCIDQLLRLFFTDISWQYDVIDEDIFREQLRKWERVPYASRSTPLGLDPVVRYFPALLFQVLAQAVLLRPRREDDFIEELMQAPDMNLTDLAAEFSDAGHQILSLFGSAEPALVKVQSALQRATFLKTTGSVVDAWHTLGSAIRDAQELGLHRLYPSSDFDAPASSEETRLVAAGRKVWLVLHLWDAHMGVVLGRPMITHLDPEAVSFPHFWSHDGAEDSDGPVQQITPFDVILCGYHTAYKHLQDIHKLDASSPNALETVNRIEAAILASIGRMPVWAWSASLVHDSRCPWLPAARETLTTEINFTLLALHRPFIFSHASNRFQALKAAVQVLQSQNRLFCATEPRSFPVFNLIFATFDATVVLAAIYILFPRENPEHLQNSLQCVQWALGRLHAMKTRNVLAASAYAAVQTVYEKFSTSISGSCALPVVSQNGRQLESPLVAENVMPEQVGFTDLQSESASAISQGLEQNMQLSPLHNLAIQDWTTCQPSMHLHDVAPHNNSEAQAPLQGDWQLRHNESIVPPLPLHDLIFQDPTTNVSSMSVHDTEVNDFWQVLHGLGN